jgi:hypothetical protein
MLLTVKVLGENRQTGIKLCRLDQYFYICEKVFGEQTLPYGGHGALVVFDHTVVLCTSVE